MIRACSIEQVFDKVIVMGDGITTEELAGLVSLLASPSPAVTDAERVDRIAVMEQVKAALCAAQARETVTFKESQLAEQDAAGVPARNRGKGIAAQVALARRESPHKGARLVGLAEALVGEMPHTLAALERGEINEWRATLAARETACLSRADRAIADTELGPRLAAMGDRQVETEFKKIAYRLDPHAFTARLRKAETDRGISLRPAPDAMTYLTALLPMKQGVAAYAALTQHADQTVAHGDERSRGQIMADTLVSRLTGATDPDHVSVEVQLVVSDQTLAGADDHPAHLQGYGPVPAPWARDLIRDTPASVWLRKLYGDHGGLVAMESTRRLFPEGLRRFIVARDQVCRTPWCNAPIRHLDHVIDAETGGPTSEHNGQGLCVTCNHAKTGHGWHARPGPDGAGHHVITTTPTGHRYQSRPPTQRPPVPMEVHFQDFLLRYAA